MPADRFFFFFSSSSPLVSLTLNYAAIRVISPVESQIDTRRKRPSHARLTGNGRESGKRWTAKGVAKRQKKKEEEGPRFFEDLLLSSFASL